MQLPKAQLVSALLARGEEERADRALLELPDEIDTRVNAAALCQLGLTDLVAELCKERQADRPS